MRNKITAIIIVLCVLSFIGISTNGFAEEQKVLGKAQIKKGTTLGGAVGNQAKTVISPFTFIAFEDMELYITRHIPAVAGDHGGGYVVDGANFAHTCPTHGKEIIGDEGEFVEIGIPQEMIDSGEVIINLF